MKLFFTLKKWLSKRTIDKQHAEDSLAILDIFVISTALTVLGIRLFLHLTDYPQVGSDTLHIAHMLWGGLAMMVVILYLLFSAKPNKYIASLIAGVGFGFFIDEIGKFVTTDNDYFFQPTAALIYVVMLFVYMISRISIVWFYAGSLVTPANFPKQKKARLFVLLVSIYATAISLVFFVSQFGGFGDLGPLRTPLRLLYSFGVFVALAWNVSGLYAYKKGSLELAASNIRNAGLVLLLVVFPVIFYRNEFSASFSFMLVLIMINQLSSKSVKDIIGGAIKTIGK